MSSEKVHLQYASALANAILVQKFAENGPLLSFLFDSALFKPIIKLWGIKKKYAEE
jgi:hypothetical protein